MVRFTFARFVFGLVVAGAVVSPLTAFAAAPKGGDANAGEVAYQECAACHSFGENKIGPNHCGLIGRKAATVADFPSYSHAMKESGLTWDEKTLSEFIENPLSYVPETAMGFVGLSEEQARLDLIAYIKKMDADASVCPK